MLKGYNKVFLSHCCSMLSGKGPRSSGLPPSVHSPAVLSQVVNQGPLALFFSVISFLISTVCKVLHPQWYLQLLWFSYFFLPPHPPPSSGTPWQRRGKSVVSHGWWQDSLIAIDQERCPFSSHLTQIALGCSHEARALAPQRREEALDCFDCQNLCVEKVEAQKMERWAFEQGYHLIHLTSYLLKFAWM